MTMDARQSAEVHLGPASATQHPPSALARQCLARPTEQDLLMRDESAGANGVHVNSLDHRATRTRQTFTTRGYSG